MKTVKGKFTNTGMVLVAVVAVCAVLAAPLTAIAVPVVCPIGSVPAFPGSDTCILDPLSINKYELPLVIPPVMANAGTDTYDIAVRQFQQQILPGGIWNTLGFTLQNLPPTTVWSYGPTAQPLPPTGVAPDITDVSQFNYPSYTIETQADTRVDVRWRNELLEAGNFLPHILSVDQTLHWANPAGPIDRHGTSAQAYTGPVPIITHVHGAHVDPASDGYPEAWWLPAPAAAGYTPCIDDIPGNPAGCYVTSGTLFDDATGAPSSTSGYVDFSYRQDQPATTLWYHDHTLGMTRTNVYAGPAGFWLVRGTYTPAPPAVPVPDGVIDGVTLLAGILPGPAPVAGQGVLALNNPADPIRQSIREIPIVIQDRSFKPNGDLFYPQNRAFFEGLNVANGNSPILSIDFAPDSDIAPIWNPEAFFTTMVVNGVVWPQLEVAPALYRFRLLNGCNSRFLNLALTKGGSGKAEIPFYQIGAEQGFLPNVVNISTGYATPLPGDGRDVCKGKSGMKGDKKNCVTPAPGTFAEQALLMGLAERADVIVDFRGLATGDVVRMINTAPDAPFGGFPDIPADPATTGQVMRFVVNSALLGMGGTDGAATDPVNIIPINEPASPPGWDNTQNLSLNEEESEAVCVEFDMVTGDLLQLFRVNGSGDPVLPPACFDPDAIDPVTGLPTGAVVGVPMAPKAALLGTFDITTGASTPLLWSAEMTERPLIDSTELWEIYNLTADAHPIHLHLVRFEVVDRQLMDLVTNLPVGPVRPPEPWEAGYKDTFISYPGEVSRVKATFDIAGLYVWHCHIVEHEDNEMMRPYCVDDPSEPGFDPDLGGSCPGVP